MCSLFCIDRQRGEGWVGNQGFIHLDPTLNGEQCGYQAANFMHGEMSDDKALNLSTNSNWILCLILLNRKKEHNYEKTKAFLLKNEHTLKSNFHFI